MPVKEEGQVVRWFGTCTDVHEQKLAGTILEAEVLNRTEQLRQSLIEKETLIKEVHHRVKNNLQMISSLLSLHSDALTESSAIAALKESQQRIVSMAMVHEQLYGAKTLAEIDFSEYAETLINELVHSSTSERSRVSIHFAGAPVQLNVDQAIPCGLILNELITNALKYAYPEGREGVISVSCGEGSTETVVLAVVDQGIGLPAGFDWRNARSLGLSLVNLLAKQLGGSLTIEGETGVSAKVEFKKRLAGARSAAAA